MRTKRAGSKWPGYVLGGLVLVAIVLMIVTPREPPTPGPIGVFGYWKSTVARGAMSASAVNPSGTMWAGAWNEKAEGKTISAVWIIDFKKEEARKYGPKSGSSIADISWMNDTTIAAKDLGAPTMMVDAITAKGQYLSRALPGEAKPPYPKDKLPGIVVGSWTSPAGTLILCRHMDDFKEMIYDPKTGLLHARLFFDFPNGEGHHPNLVKKIDVKTDWPKVPKEMLFVTYRGGFKLDLATCKATKIFDYRDLTLQDDHWRNEVQDGRLYPRKDGTYVSVSNSAGTVDIRILGKNGRLLRNLLPRS